MNKSKQQNKKSMDELKKIAPELSKIKKENPFRVPENYFENFSARLHEKLEAEKAVAPEKRNRIIQLLKPAIGLAAGFALIFTVAYWPLKTSTLNQQAENVNTETEIFDMHYASMVEEIDENSFYALLDEPNGTIQINEEDMENYIKTNSSEYEIYSATNSN